MQVDSSGRKARYSFAEHLLGDGLIVAVLIAWWLYTRTTPEYIFPSPQAVAASIFDLFTNPSLIGHTISTILRVVVAVFCAALIGGALAMLAYYIPLTRDIVHERIQPFLVAFPSIGWALLAIIWFNISDTAVIFVQIAVLTPFCLINIGEGIRELDRELIEMTRSLTRSRRRTFVKIIWPSLFPFVIAGMRMSYGVARKVALIAEVFGATSGLGFLMHDAQEMANTSMVFATCLALVILFGIGDRFVFEPASNLYRGGSRGDNGS